MLALIMAGGLGTRFWPKSRREHPKQLLKMFGEKTLIQNTVNRLLPIISNEDIYVVSTEEQLEKIKEHLPELPEGNFIVEPMGKNTAPCIGLASIFMQKKHPGETMVVLPADHLIFDDKMFHETLLAGAKAANEFDSLVTIGIKPTYPATGYGYIQLQDKINSIEGIEIFNVKTFAEKPNEETAKSFIQSGDFLWNSGIFMWKIERILDEIKKSLPDLYDGLIEIDENIGTANESEVVHSVYGEIKGISIDYGIMEAAEDVKVLRGSFGWNDLGSWEEVYKLHEKDAENNVLIGQQHLVKECRGCYIDSQERSVAIVGIDNLIVVDAGDVILLCPRDRAQDVKALVEMAKQKMLTQYL